MNKRMILGLIGLVVVILIIGFSVRAVANAPKPPTPTPTPTSTPAPTLTPGPTPTPAPIEVYGLGGPIILKDPDIRKILGEVSYGASGNVLPPVIVTFEDVGTSVMLDCTKFENVDFVFPGDSYYANQYKCEKVLASKTQFTTKLMLYSWWAHMPALMEAGFAVKQDNYFFMPEDKAAIVLEGADQEKTWREIGVNLDGLIDLNGSTYGSSTGIEQMAWMANCFANGCVKPIDISQLPSVLPKLITYVRQQGGQGSSSLRSFGDFMSNGEGTKFFIGYDSAFISWAKDNGWSDETINTISSEPKNGEPNRLVGIYLGGGTSAQHTFLALTENGKILFEKLNDPRIREIAWAKLGMSTEAIFKNQPPISWMSSSVPVGDKPRDEVYSGFLEALNAVYVKK